MASCIVKHQLLTETAHAKIFLATETGCPGRLVIKSEEADCAESLKKEKDVYDDLGRDCPNVVTCYGCYRSNEEDGYGEIYNLVMEYATEGSMEGLMKNGKLIVNGSGPMDVVDQIRVYSKMILKGLEHIHESGYVHCNLNPTNILAFLPDKDEDIETKYCYRLKISDFKLCKRTRETVTSNGTKRTYWSRFRVNPRYISPESVLFEEYEPPMDIWALGCIVNEMVSASMTGGLPVREHVKVAARRALLGVAPEIPKNLCFWGVNFLSKCFEVRPECRWTAKMLLEHPFITGRIGRIGYMMGTDIVLLKAKEEEEEEEDDSWVQGFYDFLDADFDKEATGTDDEDDDDDDDVVDDYDDEDSWVPVCDVYGDSDLDDKEDTDDDDDDDYDDDEEDTDDDAGSGSTSASSSSSTDDEDTEDDASSGSTSASGSSTDDEDTDDDASSGSTSASGSSTDDDASSGSTSASSSSSRSDDEDTDDDASSGSQVVAAAACAAGGSEVDSRSMRVQFHSLD